jgi:hypothetical protein
MSRAATEIQHLRRPLCGRESGQVVEIGARGMHAARQVRGSRRAELAIDELTVIGRQRIRRARVRRGADRRSTALGRARLLRGGFFMHDIARVLRLLQCNSSGPMPSARTARIRATG